MTCRCRLLRGLLLLFCTLSVIHPSRGAEIKVDSLADAGPGTLRTAVTSAQDGDVILLRARGDLVLKKPILVSADVRIEGADGPLEHRISSRAGTVFEVLETSNATIARLSVDGVNGSGAEPLIRSVGQLTIESCRIVNGSGGAISQVGGLLNVDRSHFEGNAATTGGAIHVTGAPVVIGSSGFLSNNATGTGGALWLESATATIINSLFTQNSAGATGGAIHLETGTARLINLTLASNASGDGRIVNVGSAGSLELGNSLVAEAAGYGAIGGPGTVTSLGRNLTSGATAPWASASDKYQVALGLSPLADRGGISPTLGLDPGSPAIDAGDNALAAGRDQRGLARFSDGDGNGTGALVDVGSFEVQLYVVSTARILGSSTGGEDDGGYGNPFDPSDDAASIASADVFALLTNVGKADIGDAVGANNAAGGGAVSFSSDLSPRRITLKGSELEVRRDLAILGPGANQLALDGDARSRVLRVSEGALLHIRGLSIENGSASTGSGILVETGAVLDLEAVSIAHNVAGGTGGGIALDTGLAYVLRSSILSNSAGGSGGGVSVGAASEAVIDTSTLSLNNAGQTGGAIRVAGMLRVLGSTLVDNASSESAPGLFFEAGATGAIRNSIFRHEGTTAIASDASASVQSLGHNISDASEPVLTEYTDLTDTDPQVSPLGYNGGTTLSHAPQPGGPAINAGANLELPELDQPGFARVRGGVVDVGSVEFQNDAPVIECPIPLLEDCSSAFGTPVTIAVSIQDPEAQAITIVWRLNGIVIAEDSIASGTTHSTEFIKTLDLPVGSSTVSITATDVYSTSTTCVVPVSIVDTTPPLVQLIGESEVTLECGETYVDAKATATDACDPDVSVSVHETTLPQSGALSEGVYSITYKATDSAGNTGYTTRVIRVEDTTAPVLTLLGADPLYVECGSEGWTDPGIEATDICSGTVEAEVSFLFGGSPVSEISTTQTGTYTVVYTAADAAGNTASIERSVVVHDTIAPTISAPENITAITDPGFCSAELEFAATASDNCSLTPERFYFILPNEVFPEGQDITSPYRFPPGNHEIECLAIDAAGNTSSDSFEVSVSDPYLNCVNNTSWPNALPLELAGTQNSNQSSASIQQFLALTDQARWYRFDVQPGSRVTVVLSNLPANYDLVVYRDISAEYERLLDLFLSPDPEQREAALLGAEFAPESFSPESFSPESFSPESFSPESFSPESFSPESFSPESFSPESFSPESFSPESFSPESFSPESFSPESFSPESFSPESFSPESFSPESFSPESFSAAQLASVIGFSAFPGVVSEGIRINTFDRSGTFYVRVRGSNGAFNLQQPFQCAVVLETELCEGFQGPETFGSSTLAADAGNYRSIIVWDSTRTPGTAEEIDALRIDLTAFAARPEVAGIVVDVSEEGRVLAANAQADALPACPFTKNLVAEEIKAVIDRWKGLNPEIEYIVLVGNDDAIPFFRLSDKALLANESNYVPPVIDSTHSQSSLRFGQMLSQDPYGSSCELILATGPYAYPEIPVGRLVETAADASGQIANYMTTQGGLLPTPDSALVTGYDFLDDAARAVQFEFEAALGVAATSLIADSSLAPSEGWTAGDLASVLLDQRHDLIFLAGHFSTGSALAADYETRLTAAQLLASPADFLNAIVFSAGCHSGYNTVDAHAITGITKQPDWSQAFARKGAVFIAGTGYQYGDTEFIEYGERLYLEFARELRSGTGPVSVGDALVAAKRRYLAETPLMRGIHEKTLVQATLFGLPMLKVDVPGQRTAPATSGIELVTTPATATANPGLTLGLSTADVSIEPGLTERFLDLVNIEDGSTVTARWFEGRSGIVTTPVEPVRPLESYRVAQDAGLLRGVGFRGGSYTDLTGFLPLTGAPTTEIRGVYGNFFSEVFYPVQPYSVNQFGTLCGGSDEAARLNVYPSQFLAEGGGALGGTMRTYATMDFRLYLSDNFATYNNSGVPSRPALSSPPSIAQVRSESDAADTVVTFRVRVLGNPAAGIQEAWITYTGIPGSSLHGFWRSLDLEQDAVDSTLWTAQLMLNGTPSDEIRFMVQAVSGVGLVSLDTNGGRYHEVGVDDFAPRLPTEIELLNPPASGAYGDVLAIQARLTSDGEPIEGLRVNGRIGTSKSGAFTNADGIATIHVALATRPAQELLQAYFSGDRTYAPSAASASVDVVKQATLLRFDPLPPEPTGADVKVALSDANGTPLKERTVFFLADYGTFALGNAVITDISGRADLAELNLPAGNVSITAYFNGVIPVPGSGTVTIPDDLYLPSTANIVTTLVEPAIEDSLSFDTERVDVHYKSPGNARRDTAPVYENASINGSVEFTVPLQPTQLLSRPDSPTIEATVEAHLAGKLIATDTFLLDTRGDDGNHWTTARRPAEAVSYVGIHWSDAPRFDSALSSSPGPRIYSTFIGRNYSELRFVPVAGTYETVLPGGITIAVKNGSVDLQASRGLREGDYTLEADELLLVLDLEITPGMVIETRSRPSGNLIARVVVTEGINYLLEGGRMTIRLVATAETPQPDSNAQPNLFEFRMVLGSGEGETAVISSARIGEGTDAVPWSSEDPNHKQYRP